MLALHVLPLSTSLATVRNVASEGVPRTSLFSWTTRESDAEVNTSSIKHIPRFDVVWNGPSNACGSCKLPVPLSPANYSIRTNAGGKFDGDQIVLLYATGRFPTLTGTFNATPCWTGRKPCSWNPWGDITPVVNGGVPQAADLATHVRQLTQDVVATGAPTDFAGLLILDWEAWRPSAEENDDFLSMYTEYSARLVRKEHPSWNASAALAEGKARFNAGARAFFSVTVEALRQLRPHARIGFYSQGINEDSSPRGQRVDGQLSWLWEIVDVLTPSIYPHGREAAALAAATNSTVSEAIRLADQIARQRRASGDPRPAPAVYPYARALVDGHKAMSRGQLAAAIQVAAGLGAEGVVLWGSTSDYTCAPNGCALVKHVLDDTAGPLIRACVADRDACAAAHCSGRGRCVDYTADRLEQTCLPGSPAPTVGCRCDAGYRGARCEEAPSRKVYSV